MNGSLVNGTSGTLSLNVYGLNGNNNSRYSTINGSIGATQTSGAGGIDIVNREAYSGGVLAANGLVISGQVGGAAGVGQNVTITNQATGSYNPMLISGSLQQTVTGVTQNSSAQALKLSGTNTNFAGSVNLQAGTLQLGSATALGGNGSTTGTGGTLTISGGTSLDSTVANLALTTVNAIAVNGDFTFTGTQNLTLGTGAVTLSGGNRTLTVTANTLTVGGSIGDGGNAYSLTKAGAGTLVLSGTSTFTGGLIINAGVLSVTKAAALPSSGAITFGGGTLLANAGVGNGGATQTELDALRTKVSDNANFGFNITGGSLSYNTTAATTLSTVTRGVGGFVAFNQSADNQVTVTTALSASNQNGILPWAIIKNGSTIDLAVGGAASSAVSKYASYTIDGTTWGATVNARPTASATLSAASSVNALVLDNGVNLTQGGNNLTFAGTGLIVQSGGNSTISIRTGNNANALALANGVIDTESNLTIAGGNTSSTGFTYTTLTKTGAGTLFLGTTASNSRLLGNGNTINLNQGLIDYSVDSASFGAWAYQNAGTMNFNGGNLYVRLSQDTGNNDGNSNRNYSLAFNADATITLDRTTAGAGRSLALGSASGGVSSLTFNNGATLTVTGGASATGGTSTFTYGNTAGTGGNLSKVILNSNATIKVENGATANTAVILNGVVDDSGRGFGLIKQGTGSVTLSGINTYSGTTNITGGTLKLGNGGSIANSSQIIVGANTTLDVSAVAFTLGASSAQQLSGSGTIVGNVNVGTTGTLAIGNSSPGTMTFDGNIGLTTGSVSNFEINSITLGNYDLAAAAALGSQTVDFSGGTLNLLFQSGFSTLGAVKLFDFDTYTGTGFTSVVPTGLAAGLSATFNAANGIVTVIPEPRAALLGCLGLVALLRRRRS